MGSSIAKNPPQWQMLTNGLEYRVLNNSYLTPWSHIHVFRISLDKMAVSSMLARSFSKKLASVHEMAHKNHALLSINGGFFDEQFQPMGLRISNFEQENPLKKISWWGVFYIQNQKPYIKNPNHFTKDKSIEFAIQSGPRLLINGRIPSLKPGLAERSALGITKDGHLLILATENNPMTTTQLAKLMQSNPLNCIHALNLDGGSSTQLWASIHNFKLAIHGYSNVSDAVLVKARI